MSFIIHIMLLVLVLNINLKQTLKNLFCCSGKETLEQSNIRIKKDIYEKVSNEGTEIEPNENNVNSEN